MTPERRKLARKLLAAGWMPGDDPVAFRNRYAELLIESLDEIDRLAAVETEDRETYCAALRTQIAEQNKRIAELEADVADLIVRSRPGPTEGVQPVRARRRK